MALTARGREMRRWWSKVGIASGLSIVAMGGSSFWLLSRIEATEGAGLLIVGGVLGLLIGSGLSLVSLSVLIATPKEPEPPS